MFDHITLHVRDIPRATRFYDAVLAPIGLSAMVRIGEDDHWTVAYGDTRPFFWLGHEAGSAAAGPVHVAFVAPSREAVDTFHRVGLEAGGREHGAPGLRPHYDPNYYAAFLIDPDGNNIEAVCRLPA